MMSGSPRNRSVYPAASARSGKNTGPRSVRMTARSVPSSATPTTATASTWMLTHRPSMTRGHEAIATSRSKKLCRTRSKPGVLTTANQMTTANTIVETSDTSTERVVWRRR